MSCRSELIFKVTAVLYKVGFNLEGILKPL